jgi:hypothetical protein
VSPKLVHPIRDLDHEPSADALSLEVREDRNLFDVSNVKFSDPVDGPRVPDGLPAYVGDNEPRSAPPCAGGGASWRL